MLRLRIEALRAGRNELANALSARFGGRWPDWAQEAIQTTICEKRLERWKDALPAAETLEEALNAIRREQYLQKQGLSPH